MTRILAFDTSCESCSVALLVADESVGDKIFSDHQHVPRQHTKRLLPMIDGVLVKAGLTVKDLDAIAFGVGPGSFTGLRITAGVAQGLGLGANKPLLPISTLATLAEQAYQKWGAERVFAGLDARMSELYWAAYQRSVDGWHAVTAEQVSGPEVIDLPEAEDLQHEWAGIGPAWKYQSLLPEVITAQVTKIDADSEPNATAMLALAKIALEQGKTIGADEVLPTYLRDNVAWEKSKHRDV